MPTQYALEKAAQCWCDDRTSKTVMNVELATVFAETLDRELDKMKSAGEFLWIVLANVGNGQGRSWEQESDDWQKAAAKAREDYWKVCSEMNRKTA